MEPSLEIELLGHVRVRQREERLRELETPRLSEFIGRLAVRPGEALNRTRLAFELWPGATETRARGNLRKLLYDLLERLPEADQHLLRDRWSIRWRLDSPSTVDVIEFCRNAETSAGHAAWRRAVRAYRGEFLPGSYSEWVLNERERLHGVHIATLRRLAEHHEAKGEFGQATEFLETSLRRAPYDEAGWESLVALHAAAGNRTAALEAYERCRELLLAEFGTEPPTNLVNLAERLRRTPSATGFRAARAATSPPPLVGREGELALLKRWAHKALRQGEPTLLLIEGEAGVGKSRLAEELTAWAAQQGVSTLAAQAYQSDTQIALAPVRALLLSKKSGESLETVLHEGDRPEAEEPQDDAGALSARRRHELFAALQHALVTPREPTWLLLDDLHWWDELSANWLHYLLTHARNTPLTVVATLRSEEESITAIPSLLAALESTGSVRRLELGPLTEAETARLVTGLTGNDPTPAGAARIHRETEGNPLFVLEWAQAYGAGIGEAASGLERHLDPLSGLPQRIHGLIMGRLLALTDSARGVADAAAVLGRAFTWPLISRTSELKERALIEALEELCRRRVLRERGTGGYDFAHGRIRDVVNARLSTARRRYLHGRAASALEQLSSEGLLASLESGTEAAGVFAAQLAAHLESAGRLVDAATQYAKAARASLAVYANELALSQGEKGLAVMRGLAPTAAHERLKATLWEGIGDVHHLLGRHGEAAAAYEEALHAVTGAGRTSALKPHEKRAAPPRRGAASSAVREAQLLTKMGNTARDLHDFERALTVYDRVEQLLAAPTQQAAAATEAPTADTVTRALLEARFERLTLYYRTGRSNEMAALAEAITPLVERSTSPAQRARHHHSLATLLHRRDRFVTTSEMLSHVRASLRAALESGDAASIATARFSLGFARLWGSELELAEPELRAGLRGARETGDALLTVRALTYLAFLERLRRNTAATEELALEAQQLARSVRLPEYEASALAQLSWVAWRDGEGAAAREAGSAALAMFGGSGFAFPFEWAAALPLLAVGERGVELARRMLSAGQQRPPPELGRALRHYAAAAGTEGEEGARRRVVEAGIASGRL